MHNAVIHFVGGAKVRVFSDEDVRRVIEASPSGWCRFKLDHAGEREGLVRVESVAYVEPNLSGRASFS